MSVTTYFEKYRSVAVGIGVSGSGLGTFVFAPLVAFLNQEYGWRGTLMVLSGIVLNCAIFGGLFRPLASFNKENLHSELWGTCSYNTKSHICFLIIYSLCMCFFMHLQIKGNQAVMLNRTKVANMSTEIQNHAK